jgi:urea carboxylase-associated protein 1
MSAAEADAPGPDPRVPDPHVAGLEGPIVHDEVVEARAPWSRVVRAGQTLRIVDVGGNQAVDCILYSADDPVERYSAADTVTAQGNVYLVVGTRLLSDAGRTMMTITGSNVARHDTVGGACSRESNTLRYGHHTSAQHACVENFLHDHAKRGMGKRDMVSNINFFMNVPVEADGTLGIVDGISAPGLHVDLLAEMDTLVAVSNCPQINNPCNGFDPTPVRMIVTGPVSDA